MSAADKMRDLMKLLENVSMDRFNVFGHMEDHDDINVDVYWFDNVDWIDSNPHELAEDLGILPEWSGSLRDLFSHANANPGIEHAYSHTPDEIFNTIMRNGYYVDGGGAAPVVVIARDPMS